MLCITYRKDFEVNFKFDRNFHSKPKRILLTYVIFSSEILPFVSIIRDRMFETTQFFTTTSTYNIMGYWQISWFPDFICFFRNLNSFEHTFVIVFFWTRCWKFHLISHVRPQTRLNNMNIIFTLILFNYLSHL